MPSDISRAKELYFKYGGNTFHMYREGDSKEYESYNINKEQEKEWDIEQFEEALNKIDINDWNLIYPLTYLIQTHLIDEYLEKLLNLISKNFDSINNQYMAYRIGQEVFSLVHWFSRNKENTPRELKLRCIYTSENLAALAKDLTIPEGFEIPYFSQISDGQTPEVYILRSIGALETNLEIAKILR